MRAVRGRARGDERGVGRGGRDRAGAVRGVHPGRLPRRHRRPALPAVRGHARHRGGDLGLHRAHAHAGAVRAADEARRTTSRACSARSTSASPGSTRRFLGGVELALQHRRRVAARASLGDRRLACAACSCACRQLRAVRGPGLHLRPIVHCPTARRSSARGRIGAQLQQDRAGRTRRRARVRRSTASTSSAAATRPTPATMFIPLKDWSERTERRAAAIAARRARARARRCAKASVLAFNPPAIRGLGTAGGFEVYVQARASADPQQLDAGDAGVHRARCASTRSSPASTPSSARRCRSSASRSTARRRSRSACRCSDVFDALQSTMGALYVNDFNKFGRTYRVQMQADAPFRAQPEDLGAVYVRSATHARDDPAQGAHHAPRTSSAPSSSSASTASSPRKVLGSGKPGVSLGRGDPRGRGRRARSAARGLHDRLDRARRSRRSAPAAPSIDRLRASPSSWCS